MAIATSKVSGWWSSTQVKRRPYSATTRSNHSCVWRAKGDIRSTGRCRNNLAHIIGTNVSDTMAEMMIVTESVIANSRNRRPTTSAMNNSGISTAISDTVSEMIVKPICSEPRNAACSGGSPASI